MSLVKQHGPPSTIADLIGQVIDKFDAMGDATPIEVGAHYLEHFGAGSAPRVLFVPEPGGQLGGPIELGDAGSVTHSCDVFIRAAEGGGDIERFRDAYALADRVFDAIQTAGTGRVAWGKYADSSPANVDAYGAEVALSFTFTRAVRHDVALWSLPAADADATAQQSALPPGQGFGIDEDEPNPIGVVVTPKEA